MVSLDSLLEYARGGGRRHVTKTFEGLLEKLEEFKGEPDVQLEIIDYWLGLLFLTRSQIQNQRSST